MTLLENGKVKCFYCKGRGIIYEPNFSRDDVNPEICPKCKGDKYEKQMDNSAFSCCYDYNLLH